MMTKDKVDHPRHYTKGPVECIVLTEHMDFCLGNAMKYLYRVAFGGKDSSSPEEDLRKAIWYINREIDLMKGEAHDAEKAKWTAAAGSTDGYHAVPGFAPSELDKLGPPAASIPV